MPGNDSMPARRQIPLRKMQIGPADAADADPYKYLARTRLGVGPLDLKERMGGNGSRLVDDPAAHAPILAGGARKPSVLEFS